MSRSNRHSYKDRDDSNLTVDQLIGLPFVVVMKILKKTAKDQGIEFFTFEIQDQQNYRNKNQRRNYNDRQEDRNRPSNFQKSSNDMRKNDTIIKEKFGGYHKNDNQDHGNSKQRNSYSENPSKSFDTIPQKEKTDIDQPLFDNINSYWDSMSYSQKFQFN